MKNTTTAQEIIGADRIPIRLTLSRKEHDALMDIDNKLFKEAMAIHHEWFLNGPHWPSIPFELKVRIHHALKPKHVSIVTPQIK